MTPSGNGNFTGVLTKNMVIIELLRKSENLLKYQNLSPGWKRCIKHRGWKGNCLSMTVLSTFCVLKYFQEFL